MKRVHPHQSHRQRREIQRLRGQNYRLAVRTEMLEHEADWANEQRCKAQDELNRLVGTQVTSTPVDDYIEICVRVSKKVLQTTHVREYIMEKVIDELLHSILKHLKP